MDMLRRGYVTAPLLGVLWVFVIATTVAIAMSFGTGSAFRPRFWDHWFGVWSSG